MSRPISPEQYEPSWNAAAQDEAEARAESAPGHPCPDCGCMCAEAEWACWRCGAVQDDEPEDRTVDGLLSILNGTVDTRRPVDRTPVHLRTDDLPTYLAAKGEGTGMRGW